jgi:phosphopantothenoylcysteine synthetase/decarboxylase
VEGKIPSGAPVTLDLQPVPKLLEEVVSAYGPVTIAFKLGRNEEEAARRMLESGVQVVVVNAPEAMGAEEAGVTILTREGRRGVRGPKEEIAAAVWKALP